MSRIRQVKPSFFKHAELYDAEVASGLPLRVAFIGLWTVTDKRGIFAWSRNIKPDVLPYDPCDMLAVLDALAAAGLVVKYEVDGKSYGLIPTFGQHQHFHKDEKPSTMPAPYLPGAPTVPASSEHRSSTPTYDLRLTASGNREVVGVGADEPDIQPIPEYALMLTVTANQAITQKWGEQPTVLHYGAALQLASDLMGMGVELEVARASIVEQLGRRRLNDRPPTSINWFRKGIERAWAQEQQRRLDATTALPTPAPLAVVGRATGDPAADAAWNAVLDLIPKWHRREVTAETFAAMSPGMRAGIKAIGGFPKLINTPDDKRVWVKRDFVAAFTAAPPEAQSA